MRKDFLLGSAALVFLVGLAQIIFIMTKQDNRHFTAEETGVRAVAVELVVNEEERGIYFVSPAETISAFLLKQALQTKREIKTVITAGMSIRHTEGKDILIEQMAPHKKMALGIPLDLNMLSSKEIMLAPGIGEMTANKIYQYIQTKGCIDNLSELSEISGIKERKIDQLRPYFIINAESCKNVRTVHNSTGQST